MKEELVSFSTAKLAKEKGFNWKVLDTFASDGMPVSRYAVNEDGLESYITTGDEDYLEEVMELSNSEMQSDFVARPTQSLLQKWLRDEYKIYVTTLLSYKDNKFVKDSFFCEISKESSLKQFVGEYGISECFKTYEEALEFGLKEALEML